ncbi:MAG: glycoside hydrolase family 3 N-terminal domain-containing protein, partial [bacterium]
MSTPAPRAGWLIPLAVLVLILDLVALIKRPPWFHGGTVPYRVLAEAPKLPEVKKRAENRELVDQLIREMTLEQKIGQLLLVGGWSDYPAKNIAAIHDWHLGNIAVTSRDASELAALAEGISDSQETALAANNGVPLLVATTQEGGAFDALTSGSLTHLPAAADLGEYAEALEIERGYSYIGAELKSLGINTCLAPLMDIGSVAQSPLVADKRVWGRSASLVTHDAIAAIAGLQNGGIAACARNFPGMGATPVDANRVLPVIDYSQKDIEASDLVPFQSAVRQEVALVMVGHVCYPLIQGQRRAPAWTSELLVQHLLRDQMKYAGVVMTADLAADSVDQGDETLVDHGLQALKAGCDLLYFTGGADRAAVLAAGLLTATQNGDLSEDVIDTAVARILRLKTAYKLFDTVKEPPTYLASGVIPELAAHQQGIGQLFENMELRQNPNQERQVKVGLPGAAAI